MCIHICICVHSCVFVCKYLCVSIWHCFNTLALLCSHLIFISMCTSWYFTVCLCCMCVNMCCKGVCVCVCVCVCGCVCGCVSQLGERSSRSWQISQSNILLEGVLCGWPERQGGKRGFVGG